VGGKKTGGGGGGNMLGRKADSPSVSNTTGFEPKKEAREGGNLGTALKFLLGRAQPGV